MSDQTSHDPSHPQSGSHGRSPVSADLFLAIGSAIDDAMEPRLAGGLMLSLSVDPRLRGLRTACSKGIADALGCLISAAGRAGRGTVAVQASAAGDEVQIVVRARLSHSGLTDSNAIRAAAHAARSIGAYLEVDVLDGELVWRLSLFAPPASPAALIVEPDPFARIELTAVLNQLGFPVEVAADAHDLSSTLARRAFAIVTISLEMGEEIACNMCQLALAARWPPVVLGVNPAGARFSRPSILDAGFSGVLARPLSADHMGALLSSVGVRWASNDA